MIPPLSLTKADNGKYIIMYDASAHSRSNCMRALFYNIIRGCQTARKDYKMEYGTAFHKGLADFYHNKDRNRAIGIALTHYLGADVEIPDDDWRTPTHLTMCMQQYFAAYPEPDVLVPDMIIDADTGKLVPSIEHKFAFPYKSNDVCEVALCGTIDLCGKYTGQQVVADHKTTAVTNVYSYLEGYNLSPQLMFYKDMHETLFPEKGTVGCMINGIFLSKSNKNTFRRSDIYYFTNEQMDAFRAHRDLMIDWIMQSFKEHLERGTPFMQNFNCCVTKFGMCSYNKICLGSLASEENIVQTNYVNIPYNPLMFQE